MKVKVYIEQTKDINKPDEVEVKKLNWRKEKYIQGVKENKKQVYSQNLELLAKNISEGKTFCISPNGITTELLVLDIDNKGVIQPLYFKNKKIWRIKYEYRKQEIFLVQTERRFFYE